MRKGLISIAFIGIFCFSACKNASTNSEIVIEQKVKKDTGDKIIKKSCKIDFKKEKALGKTRKHAVCNMESEDLK